MNVTLVHGPKSRQLRVNFTFDWPQPTVVELKIKLTGPDSGRDQDLKQVFKMFDNLRHSQSLFTSCVDCDQRHLLVLLRRSIEQVRPSPHTFITVTVKDRRKAAKKLTITEWDRQTSELGKILGPVAPQSGHRHTGTTQQDLTEGNLTVH